VDLGKLYKDAWGLLVRDLGQLIVGLLLAGAIPGAAAAAIIVPVMFLALPGLAAGAAGDATALGAASIAGIAVGYAAVIAVMLLVAIPLYAGVLTGVLRRVREGRTMGYWDLFTGFRLFGRVVAAYALAYALVPLGVAAAPLTVIVLGAVLFSVPVLVGGVALGLAAAIVLVYLVTSWTYVLIVVIDRGVGAGAALRESRELVHRAGWWWTFLSLFLLQLTIMAVALAAGVVPFVGMAAGLFTAPYSMTFLVAMYFQSRREDWLIDVTPAAGRPPASSPPPAVGAPTG
jgi:hypothetical protein